jgi:hypothetical protein
MIILRGHRAGKIAGGRAVKLVDRVRISEDTEAHEIGRHLLSLPEVNQYIIFRLKLSGGMTLWVIST